jgi:hypothetical protein
MRFTKKQKQQHAAFVAEYDRLQKDRRRTAERLRILKLIGPVLNASYVHAPSYTTTIEFQPLAGCEKPLLRELLAKARKLTGSPQKAHKSFNENSGKVRHLIPLHPLGWTMEMSGVQPKCKVKKVTRPVHHEAREAWTEQREVYELENPEECLGKQA